MSQIADARLLTPSRTETPPASPKRGRGKKPAHNFIVPTISVTTPPSDDGHGRRADDSDDEGPGSGSARSIRSNSVKRAQKQISEAQGILGANIASLDRDPEKQRVESLGEGSVSFRYISGSRRSNRTLIFVGATFAVIVAILLLVIGIMAAVNHGSPW